MEPTKKKRGSDAYRARRAERKKNHEHKLSYELPVTPGQIKESRKQEYRYITTNAHLIQNGSSTNTVARIFKNVIPTEHLIKLFDSTEELHAVMAPKRDKKREVNSYHFGYWRCYSPEPYVTSETRTKEALQWLQANQPVFQAVGEVFKSKYPLMYDCYRRVLPGPPLVGPWCTVNINYNTACIEHIDDQDYRHGLCWVLPFGDFTGGQIFFPDLRVELEVECGDLVCFPSASLLHNTEPFVGKRHSLVFFNHHDMFFSP